MISAEDAARGELQAAAQVDDDQGNIFFHLEVFNQSAQYCTTTLYHRNIGNLCARKLSVFEFLVSDEDTAGSELQAAAQLDYGQGNIAC